MIIKSLKNVLQNVQKKKILTDIILKKNKNSILFLFKNLHGLLFVKFPALLPKMVKTS